jgi:hypothetical protein
MTLLALYLIFNSETPFAKTMLEEWECELDSIKWVVSENGVTKAQPIKTKIFFRELINGKYEVKQGEHKWQLIPKYTDKWVTVLLGVGTHEGTSLSFYGLWKKGGEINELAAEIPLDDIEFSDLNPSINKELVHRLTEGLREDTGVLMVTKWRVGWARYGQRKSGNRFGIYGNVIQEPSSEISICSIKKQSY